MDAFKEWITPIFGSWAPLVLVIVGILIWLINKLPGWLSNRSKTVHGSPSSQKYWQARYAEALAQHDGGIEQAERTQQAARITEARIMVEAHEAKRRLGMGGVAPMWILVVLFGLGAVAFFASSGITGLISLRVTAIILALLMVAAELGALQAASAGTERFNVLVAAGRFGRSDLVREDPWRVLREYDHARHALDEKRAEALAKRKTDDKDSTTRWRRFERALIGVRPYEDGIGIGPEDIWKKLAPTNAASPVTETVGETK